MTGTIERSVNAAASVVSATVPTKEKSSPNHILYGCYALIFLVWLGSQVVLIPYVIHLLVLVTAILYVACHSSLILLQDEPTAQDKANGITSNATQTETLRQEDAYQFPLMGSVSLLSLYLAFKFLDKDFVNFLIGFYFATVGCIALYATLTSLLPRWGGVWKYQRSIRHFLPKFLVEDNPWNLEIHMSLSDAVLFLLSLAVCGFYFQYKHWALNNIFGICFCLQGIERFSLGTYKIGAILLVGLFFYDIFWVFGTDVMVTVAKNLDGPIKILFPRAYNLETGKLELSLLGLGDIVIPGFFLALLLRFDATRALTAASAADATTTKTTMSFSKVYPMNILSMGTFPKPYFHSALVAYVMGLALTMYIMIVFQAAQPALLYLVPACLGSSLTCAILRGELKELLAYSEEEEETEEEGIDKESKQEGTKEGKKND